MLTERFWEKVDKSGECWVWTGARDDVNGYGMFRLDGRTRRAHRLAWEDQHGAIPAGSLLCHHCDNPPCLRSEHLYIGTQKDNMRDLVLAGHYNALKVRCPHGHEYTPANTALSVEGWRMCRTCRRERRSRTVPGTVSPADLRNRPTPPRVTLR